MPAGGVRIIAGDGPPKILDRKKIVVKGYGGSWGRAAQALRSLERVEAHLSDYEIHVTSVTRDVAREVRRIQKRSSLKLVTHKKHSLSPIEIETLFLESKFHVALSVSDGFPSSLFEAMTCGTVPIQSDTACVPQDLVRISTLCFVSKRKWNDVGKILVNLDSQPQLLQEISDKFSQWARDYSVSGTEFREIISKSYGLKVMNE
jgi:glycosyltransferase involved in cell wall biosynthesis